MAVEGASVKIFKGNTVVWSGTSDAAGVAKDINGLNPSLRYGDYYVEAVLYGYNPAAANFNVPNTTTINLDIVDIIIDITINVSWIK